MRGKPLSVGCGDNSHAIGAVRRLHQGGVGATAQRDCIVSQRSALFVEHRAGQRDALPGGAGAAHSPPHRFRRRPFAGRLAEAYHKVDFLENIFGNLMIFGLKKGFFGKFWIFGKMGVFRAFWLFFGEFVKYEMDFL